MQTKELLMPLTKIIIFLSFSVSLIALSPTLAMEGEDHNTNTTRRVFSTHEGMSDESKPGASPSGVHVFPAVNFAHSQALPPEHFLEFLRGGPPSWFSRLSYILQYKLRGWENAVRPGVSSYQVIIMSGNIGGASPQNFAEGRQWARSMTDSMAQLPIMKNLRPDRALFFTTHEFAANGKFGSTWEYSAKFPISPEAYSGIRSGVSEWLQEKPKGINFILGGAAIDTGKSDPRSGKKIGENLGFLASAGSKEAVEFRKRFESPVDNWNQEDFQVPREGGGVVTAPVEKLVPNLPDGKPQGFVAISICKDATEISKLPETPALYFITGSGIPDSKQIVPTDPRTSKILINMEQFSKDFDQGSEDNMIPILNGQIFELEGPHLPLMRKFFANTLSFWTIQPEQAQKALLRYKDVGTIRFSFKDKTGPVGGGGTMIVTEPRPIPLTMSENDLAETENLMVKEQVTVADQQFNPPAGDPTVASDPSEIAMHDVFDGNAGREQEAEGNFGEGKEEGR